MDRIATGTMIAAAAVVLTGGLGTDAMARDVTRDLVREVAERPASAAIALPQPAPTMRSGRVLALLLTLDALHQAPALLDPAKR